jgi:hypothetical protein
MNNHGPLAVILTVLGLFACGSRPERNPEAVKSAHQSGPKEISSSSEAWKRMTECSAQAERLAVKEEWGQKNSQVLGWQNHYSPTFERCYVLIQKQSTLPSGGTYMELYDAFETRFLIMCGESANVEMVCRA